MDSKSLVHTVGAESPRQGDKLPQHTPGPWEYVKSTEHHGPYVTTAADCTYGDIADCYAMSNPSLLSVRNGGRSRPIHHQYDRADANARLIAAAPDLLALVQHFKDWLMKDANPYHVNLDDMRVYHLDGGVLYNLLNEARAAISKATGQ